ncbi:MAG: FAD-dependent thymidylate synthase [Candidatus Hodarchaeales archaeon]|jgi:thymidylate synthase (FAD)
MYDIPFEDLLKKKEGNLTRICLENSSEFGQVQLIDWMGSDARIANAARVSTNTERFFKLSDKNIILEELENRFIDGTTKVDQKELLELFFQNWFEGGQDLTKIGDQNLIRFLLKNKHETPFEKVVFEFRIECPIFVMRQLVRHRIASINETSARYRVLDQTFYIPNLNTLPEEYSKGDLDRYCDLMAQQYDFYKEMISKIPLPPQDDKKRRIETPEVKAKRKRAREVWRGILGTSFKTSFYWTINLRSLFNFLSLRLALDAQYEIRQIAQAIVPYVKQVVPIAYQAFEDFILNTPEN